MISELHLPAWQNLYFKASVMHNQQENHGFQFGNELQYSDLMLISGRKFESVKDV